ncbi:MAG: gliding motility protein GldM [Bacteroidales bacterium]
MAGYKETPRQKMIAMMYLVLTALLALNVSKEMLDAFIVVNDSVELTNENFSEKLEETYQSFENKYQINQNKVRPYWDKAQEAQLLSNEMVEYINQMKHELIARTEGISVDSARTVEASEIKNIDDYDTPTNYFMGDSEDGSKGHGIELKRRIEEYRENMLSLIDPEDRDRIKLGLNTEGDYRDADGMPLNWIQYNFYHSILAADLTILNKIITEVYNAEFDIVNFLLDDVDAEDFKYDQIDAKVLPRSNYIFRGDQYEAEIIIAAYDTKQTPEAYLQLGVDSLPAGQISSARPIEGEQGKVKVTLPANELGQKKFAGIIRVKSGLGEVNEYFFNDEYFVAEPSLTVSATKMNVFYVGVDNPVEISVPGVPEESITPSISSGTLKRAPDGNWTVTVPVDQQETVISVSATIDGETRQMGAKTFRVKKLPDPVALIANKKQGPVNRNILIAAGAIIPKMPGDFEFDLDYRIKSFTMTLQRGMEIWSRDSDNNRLTEEMIRQINTANRGQKVWFENIVAVGPDGIDRPLSPIILTVN